MKILENLANILNTGDNIPKNINEVYEMYLDNEFITKNHIKKGISEWLLKLVFFFIAPFYGIIFLTGIFQIKSLMSALFALIKKSSISRFKFDDVNWIYR